MFALLSRQDRSLWRNTVYRRCDHQSSRALHSSRREPVSSIFRKIPRRNYSHTIHLPLASVPHADFLLDPQQSSISLSHPRSHPHLLHSSLTFPSPYTHTTLPNGNQRHKRQGPAAVRLAPPTTMSMDIGEQLRLKPPC